MARSSPLLLGIVNITEDSFSDGGRYLDPAKAIAHARALLRDGADAVDLGAASSNPDSEPVPPALEIERLAPVVAALKEDGAAISIDSFATETQAWALEQGVAYVNDIQGFADPALYPKLATSQAKLVVMHSIQGRGKATREPGDPITIRDRIFRFFEARIAALAEGGIDRARLILDPGMGFFLGTSPEPSLAVLRGLPELRRAFGLPVLVSVSRKSFLRAISGRDAGASGAATLTAELFAAARGADAIRTHDVGALRDALTVGRALGQGFLP